jgi:hypothetical protein
MGDLRRERDTARNERDQLRRENTALRALVGDIDPQYADAYATLCDIAHHGTKTDQPKLSSTFESQPPKHNEVAYHLRNEERRHQRIRAARLMAQVERLAGDGPSLVGSQQSVSSTRLAQPSGNGHSVHTGMVRFSLSVVRPGTRPTSRTPHVEGA